MTFENFIKFDDVMNDQRQVIFAQRLKILKDDNITNILDDFFEEILVNFDVSNKTIESPMTKTPYGYKNITGNSVSDKLLLDLSSKNQSEFLKEIRAIFDNKRKSRINILGEEQSQILEKKIFLQIIDFSWRSHLQYLEQLRQVIGLRQYGQKDPLSEFKKEAFALFENLLAKIKNDIIKFLFNLNIVVNSQLEKNKYESRDNKKDYKKVGRNEKCPCGSGKKFKHCHGSI